MTETASPFRTRTVLILIAAGLALMLGFLLVSGYGDRVDRQRGNAPSPASGFATGFKGLVGLIERSGGKVALSRAVDDRPGTGLLILTPNVFTSREEMARAVMFRREAPTLIILPKWLTAPQKLRPSREERFMQATPAAIQRMLQGVEPIAVQQRKAGQLRYPSGLDLRPFAPAAETLQTIADPNLSTLIETADGGAVLAEIKGRNIYILADPDLLNNHALADRRNARAAIALLAALDPNHPGEIAFDTMLPYGAGGRNLVQLIFEPPFVGVTLALFVAALLAGVATLNRFGPARREPRAVAFGKRALIENIVSLARRARRTREGGDAYADAIRDWAARHLSLPRTLRGEALDAHLDTLKTPTPYTEWATRARAANSDAELLQAARKLDDWRKEVKA